MQIPKFEAKEVEDGKMAAVLAYLGPLFLVAMLTKKENSFAMWHAKQGLVLFIFEVVIWVVNIVPFLGQFIWLIGSIFTIVVLVMGILKVLAGEGYEIPWIGQYAKEIKI
ncbi:MAG: DUF4870 domain-containing protein [Candidatus Buchananbacteria bacterium]